LRLKKLDYMGNCWHWGNTFRKNA